MSNSCYAGMIAYVNLSSKQVDKQPLDMDLAQKFIGGFGINTRLAYDLIPLNIPPLSPQNIIILGSGALCGTMAPGSSRSFATTLYPETNAVGCGSGSLGFASKLKYAGFDHIILAERAANPSYILIKDGNISIEDASALWGTDLVETTMKLWQKHGNQCSVIAIGPAGENGVYISLAMVDIAATLGKGGLGAVLGSKNIKAVVVEGNGGVAVADRARFMRLVDEYHHRISSYPERPEWIDKGINYTMPRGEAKTVASPHWNDPEYGMEVYLRKVKKGRYACPSCPMSDKEVLGVSEGKYKGMTTLASGFGYRARGFGVYCGAGSYDQALKCADICTRMGIDAHSFTQMFDNIIQLYQNGVITGSDTGGMEVQRDFDTTVKLMGDIAYRRGFGDLVANGNRGLIERFGEAADKVLLQVKGMGLLYDARISGFGTMEFEYVVNPRGGHHSSGGSPAYLAGSTAEKFRSHCNRMGASPEATDRIMSSQYGFSVGRLTRYSEDWYSVLSSLGFCVRAQMNRFYSMKACADFYSAASGNEITPQELAKAGERSWNVLKAINARNGFRRKDDRVPPAWFSPLVTPEGRECRLRDYYGTKELTTGDCEKMLDEYYDERGWDKILGIPTKEKLTELGLSDIAHDFTALKVK